MKKNLLFLTAIFMLQILLNNFQLSANNFPFYTITGTVYNQTNADTILKGHIHLIQYTTDNTLMPFVDSVDLNTDGTFQFNTVAPGDYLLKVMADSAMYPDAFATYYGNKVYWTKAAILSLSSDTDVSIIVKQQTPMTGNGLISGKMIEGNVFGKLMTIGDPIKDINVALVNQSNSSAVRFSVSDAQGMFLFTNLAAGCYTVFPDMTGIPIDSVFYNANPFCITTTDTVFQNIECIVDSTLIWIQLPNAIEERKDNSAIGISFYPNPFINQTIISIQSPVNFKFEILNFKLFDVLGQEVHRQIINSKSEALNVELPDGIYFYKLTHQNTNVANGKLVVAH